MIEKINKWVSLATLAVVVILAVVVLVGGKQSAPSFGGTTNFDAITLDNGNLTVSNGSIVGSIATLTGALTQGGGIRATSTVNSAETLLASDLATANVIDYTLNVQAATLTLPASSTLSSFIPTAGQMRTIWIRNATTTATNLTIAGGSGTILKIASTTDFAGPKIIYGDTDGDNRARLDFIRKSNSDIDVYMTPFRD